MKNSISIIVFCVALAFTACKGNPHTESGDSTGTGSGGARTPGNETADTTKHDSTNSSAKNAMYKDSTKMDTIKK